MAEKSNISWTDGTHNFWQGCAKVSAGCTNCYAEARDKRFTGGKLWGKGAPRQRSKSFDEPLKWNRKPWVCDDCGFEAAEQKQEHNLKDGSRCWHNPESWHRRRVFSLSLGDWLDDEVPIEWLADMLDVIRRCSNLDFLLLTKRPENWRSRLLGVRAHALNEDMQDLYHFAHAWLDRPDIPPPLNIWLGTSTEDQSAADRRIPALLKIPASVRFLSVEPMLGPVNFTVGHEFLKHDTLRGILREFNSDGQCRETRTAGIDWAIFGGESGPGARPCDIEWIRDGVRQCLGAGVAPFVKQLGSESFNYLEDPANGTRLKFHTKDKKGGDMAEWPDDLRVQEFPNVARGAVLL